MSIIEESKELCLSSDDESDTESTEKCMFSDSNRFEKIIILTEMFDKDALYYIIKNKNKFLKKIRPAAFENIYDPFAQGEKYLDNSDNGSISVIYQQSKSRGRYFSKKGLSLQNICREIRHTIANKYYVDVDMVNAHPTLLKHICETHKIKCKYLSYYVDNRDLVFKTIIDKSGGLVDKSSLKSTILSLTNGGSKAFSELKIKHKFLEKYKDEMISIHKSLCEKFKTLYDEFKESMDDVKKFNMEGGFMNSLLCNLENNVLGIIYESYDSPKDNVVLCFDGLMIKKSLYESKGSEKSLRSAETKIKSILGLEIKLKIKEMDEGFDIPTNIPIFNKKKLVPYYSSYTTLIGQEISLKEAEKWLSSIVLISNGGASFLLTKNKIKDCYTGESIDLYKAVKKAELLSNIDVEVFIKNPNYIIEKKWTPEQVEEYKLIKKPSSKGNNFWNKYMYTSLAGSKSNPGFIDDYGLRKGNIFIYETVDFLPFLKSKNTIQPGSRVFNMFTGFPLDDHKSNNINFEETNVFKHIRDQMCSTEQEFNHFMDWIADLIQKPYRTNGCSHLFFGQQGNGKSMLGDFISNLIGVNHCLNYSNIQAYFKGFNHEQSNKLLFILNEIADKGETFHNHDTLKADITKNSLRVEPKGIDAYQIRFSSRYMLFTNNENAVYVETSDRRYTLHKVSSEKSNDRVYFAPIFKEISDLKVLKAAFDYFASRKYNELDIMTAFETQYKNEQKEFNLNNSVKFIKEFIEDTEEKEKIRMSTTDLYTEYTRWCVKCGYKQRNRKVFKSNIDTLGFVEKHIKIEGKSSRGYNHTIPEIETMFKNQLKMPSFTFSNIEVEEEEEEEKSYNENINKL